MNRRNLVAIVFGVVALAVAGPFIAINADSSKPEQLVSPLDAASVASKAYMDNFVSTDGRVGDKTQFARQAQALLIAAATSDTERFNTIWNRTKTDLVKPDGSLDAESRDLLTASRSLLVAALHSNNSSYRDDALRLGSQAVA